MLAIPAHWKIYWGTLLINMWDKFFPIKVFFRMMICGGARCWHCAHRTWLFLFPAPLPPGVSVARISNETCVINPCNGVHEFTPEQRLLRPCWLIKRGMYSFHVLSRWSTLTTIWWLPFPCRAGPGPGPNRVISDSLGLLWLVKKHADRSQVGAPLWAFTSFGISLFIGGQ